MLMYGVKRLTDGVWYGPVGSAFGFGSRYPGEAARVSMFETPGKAKTVITRCTGWKGATTTPEDYAVMVVDLDQAVPYVKP
jgi:hypothetical protein